MANYNVEISTNIRTYFIVNANNKEEAAEKARKAMDAILEDNIEYDTNVEGVLGINHISDNIRVSDIWKNEATEEEKE